MRSLKAFSIQCYWRRHQRHQRAIRTKCATFIQAGTYNLYNIQYQMCYLEHYWFGPVNWSVLLFFPKPWCDLLNCSTVAELNVGVRL